MVSCNEIIPPNSRNGMRVRGTGVRMSFVCGAGIAQFWCRYRPVLAQVFLFAGAGVPLWWRRCGKPCATCATGERLCPFLGAGPCPEITPAPGGLMTCAKTSRYLRRGWQSPDPKCPHLRQNQLVPAPKCQQGAFTGNGEGGYFQQRQTTSNGKGRPAIAKACRRP